MIAGKMQYKLEILEPTQGKTGFGSGIITWAVTVVVWAERVRLSGRRTEEADEHFSDYSADWNIRDAHKIAEGWRVRQVGGLLYEVVAIEPNKRRGYVTLKTQRVNE